MTKRRSPSGPSELAEPDREVEQAWTDHEHESTSTLCQAAKVLLESSGSLELAKQALDIAARQLELQEQAAGTDLSDEHGQAAPPHLASLVTEIIAEDDSRWCIAAQPDGGCHVWNPENSLNDFHFSSYSEALDFVTAPRKPR